MSELGKELREAREAKGLSLHDIQESTKIQRRYLEAIERGDLASLPGQFYARAFIKRYSEILGMNSEEFLNRYSHEIPSPAAPQEEEETSPILQKNSIKKDMYIPSGKWISRVLMALIVVAVLSLIWLAVNSFQKKNNSPVSPSQQAPNVNKTSPENVVVPPPAQPTVPKQDSTNPATPATDGTLTPTSQEPGKSIWTYELTGATKITIQVTSKTGDKWLQVQTPKGTVEQITLKEGESKTWEITDSQEVTFYMHNATTADIKINGQAVDTSKCSQTANQYFKVTRKNP